MINYNEILEQHQIIKGERITLRPFASSDLQDLFEFTSDEEATRYLYPPHTQLEQTERMLTNYYLQQPTGIYAIEHNATKKMIGTIEFRVNVFRLDEINNPDYETATPIDSFDSDNIPAFCYVVNDTLYVGEFYRSKSYETPENHHIQTESGEYQMAIMTVFDANELTSALSSKGAIDDVAPTAVYSIKSGAQGMCVLKGGQICISSSWGLSTSHVTIYEDPMKSNLTSDSTFITESGEEVPLYYLDQESELKDFKLPAMAEELVTDGDKVLVMNESASNKYFFGKLIGGKYCYSFIPEY